MRNGIALCRADGSINLYIWALDTKKTRINRYRSYDWSWRKIADIYGVNPTTARRWSVQ